MISSISASAAFALRLHMPEPEEFVHERREVIHQNLVRIASRRSSSAGGSFSRKFSRGRFDSEELNGHSDNDAAGHNKHLNPHGSHAGNQAHLQKLYSLSEDDTTPAKIAAAPPAAAAAAPAEAHASVTIDGTEGIPEKKGEYVPAIRLLRKHWAGVVLQFLFEAWVSIAFYVITSWLPIQLKKPPVNMPEILTQAMLIVNLIVMAGTQLAAGWASDKGVPRVWSCFGVYLVAAAISVPVFLGFRHVAVAGAWLLHLLLMVLMAWVLGVIPGGQQCGSCVPLAFSTTTFITTMSLFSKLRSMLHA